MTNVDVLFRYEHDPSESAMFALGNLKEVYGIRRIEIDQPGKTIRVEYDATRLTRAVVANLLRRGGIGILEEVALVAPQNQFEHPDASQPPAAAK
jgi:copper chaperone CopZ